MTNDVLAALIPALEQHQPLQLAEDAIKRQWAETGHWTERNPLEPPEPPKRWTRFIKPVWWAIIAIVGVWSLFQTSGDDDGGQDAAVQDAGGSEP